MNILFSVLGAMSIALANANSIPFTVTASMYGAGSMIVACEGPNMVPGECKVDTGMNISYFKTEMFTVLPESLGKSTFASVTGTKIQCDFVALPEITLGGQTTVGPLEPVVCPTYSDKTKSNLLGLDMFAGKSFVIDNSQKEIRFLDTHPKLPHTFTTSNVGHMLVETESIKDSSVKLLALFDTGASVSAVDVKFALAHPEMFTVINEMSSSTDSHGNVIKSYLTIGSIKVGDAKVVADYFIAMDLSAFRDLTEKNIEMIVGFNAIDDFNWTFNMNDSTWDVVE